MSIEENKAVARRFMDEIVDKGHLSVMDEMFDENFINHYTTPDITPDMAGLKQLFKGIHDSFSDINYVTDDIIAEDDKVVIRITFNATSTGEFRGAPVASGKIKMTSIIILRIVNGKIIERWGNADELGLSMQLGIVSAQEYN
jgi:predicted ester cyclase